MKRIKRFGFIILALLFATVLFSSSVCAEKVGICLYCGAKVSSNDVFCQECGKKLQEVKVDVSSEIGTERQKTDQAKIKAKPHPLGTGKLELITSDADIKALMVEWKETKERLEQPEWQVYMTQMSTRAFLIQRDPNQPSEVKEEGEKLNMVVKAFALAKEFAINYVNNSSASKVFAHYGTFNSGEGQVIIYIHSIESTIFGVNITFRAYVKPPTSSVQLQLVGFKGSLDVLDVFGESLLKTDIKYSQRCLDIIEFTRSVKAGDERANELRGIAFTDCKDANIATKWGQTLDVIWRKFELK